MKIGRSPRKKGEPERKKRKREALNMVKVHDMFKIICLCETKLLTMSLHNKRAVKYISYVS